MIDQKGRLLHSTGDQRVEVPLAGDLDLQTLWGSGPEDIWAGGKGVLRGNLSDGFRRVDQGALTEVTKLAGSAPNNVGPTLRQGSSPITAPIGSSAPKHRSSICGWRARP